MRTALFLLLAATTGFAQTAKKPALSDSFSKAGLKALFAIQQSSEHATDLLDDARMEMDASARPDEVTVFSQLDVYRTQHRTNLLNLVTLRSTVTTEVCRHSSDDCINPVAIDNALLADQRYKDLVAKDALCSASIEHELRTRSVGDVSKSCTAR